MQTDKNQQSYFDAYPEVDVFHFTADGMAFFQKGDAEAHAASLQEKAVTTLQRNAAPVAEPEAPADTEQETPAETPAKPATKKKK